jgi:predicted HTH transcriptional regulator
MNYEELTNIIKLAPKENEQWDFKEKWHESNGELLRDIINFTNTPSHNDAYIIFGISDQDGSVIGIDKNDPNRKNKQQLQDYLRNIPFAQNYYPT